MKKVNIKKKLDTILVTGGGGLIGSSLIFNLQDKYNIICLDHGSNFFKFRKVFRENVKLIKGDVRDVKLLDKILKNCDIIIHLAGGGGNPACVNNPVMAVKTHIIGIDLLLKRALKNKVKKIIFASSQSVYTTFHKRRMPFFENIDLEPDDFYGMLKKSAEDLIKESGINYSILRLANVYGGSSFFPMQAGGAINNFIKAGIDKKNISIYGKGNQGIDFINLKDVIKAIDLVLKQKKKNVIYNLGSGKLIKIKEITKMVSSIFKNKYNQKIEIKKMPIVDGKIWPDRLMSINKIKKDLGWKTEITLRKGLEEMIINYKN